MFKKLFHCLVFALFLYGCAPINSGPRITNDMAFEEARSQQRLLIDEHRGDLDRLMRVSHIIKKANTALCYDDNDEQRREAGFYVDASQFLMYNDQPVGAVSFSSTVKAYPMVVYRVPGSGAERAFLEGDLITAIGDTPLNKNSIKANIDLMGKEMAKRLKSGHETVPVTIDRNGTPKSVSLSVDRVCPTNSFLSVASMAGQEANAYADGDNIVLRSSIIKLAGSDEKIALIVGHEMAHNTMSHIAKKQGNAVIGGLVGVGVAVLTGVDMSGTFSNMGAGAFSQEFEAEADYFGTYYAARAGYDVSSVHEFWRQMAVKYPGSIHLAGTSHPSSAKRFIAIKHTADEIAAKKRAGKPLIPDYSGFGLSFETQPAVSDYN